MVKVIAGRCLHQVSDLVKIAKHLNLKKTLQMTSILTRDACSMWLLYFCNAFRSSLANNLDPYVSSSFKDHSLLPVISVVSSVMSAAFYFPVAKILNLWDRCVGFLLMLTIATLGMVLMAACDSFELYAAANVSSSILSFHQVGLLD